MQPADAYYDLLSTFSKSPCVEVGKVDRGVSEEMINLGVAYVGLSGEICVKSMVQLAMFAVKRGCDPRRVSTYLNWRDFEAFVADAFLESGYEVFRNVRFGRRRLEFDVLAISTPSSLGIAVDCKHWSPRHASGSKIKRVSLEHLEKLRGFLEWCGYELSNYPLLRSVRDFLGVVVTMGESVRGPLGGVVVVPIYYFGNFIANLRYYVDTLGIATLRNPCYLRDPQID